MSPTTRRMPAEWEPHTRTWLAFPPANETFGSEGSDSLAAARQSWSEVARRIAGYEPVTLVAPTGLADTARALAGPAVQVIELALDDAWMRDIGPTFVATEGQLTAIDWTFNGWGGQDWASWDRDRLIAGAVAAQAGVSAESTELVNEGGGFHVDGSGTVLLTETVQLDPGRNPDWTKPQVEREIHTRLGTTKAIWLPRGLTADYERFGTRGHVDIVATFTPTGAVAVHHQADPAHPDHPVSAELIALLRGSTDAAGRPLEIVEVPAPTADHDGRPSDYSYINHYVGNGFVIVGLCDDPADAEAVELLGRLYPGRTIETVDGRGIFAFGGGVHCITQQQPRL